MELGHKIHLLFGLSVATGSNTLRSSVLPTSVGFYLRPESRSVNTQEIIRTAAETSVVQAMDDGLKLIEVEFPPLLGGPLSKTSLDDFSNVDVLDANRDWCIQFMSSFANKGKKAWLLFPDLKEAELALTNWPGEQFKRCTWSTIENAATKIGGSDAVSLAWGSRFARAFEDLTNQTPETESYIDNLDDEQGIFL